MEAGGRAERLNGTLRALYEGDSKAARRFRYGLLAFDLATILFIIGSSFFGRAPAVIAIDLVAGVLVLADFTARLSISRTRLRDLLRPSSLADGAAIVSFVAAPFLGEGLAFLRVLRTLRLLRTYQVVERLRQDSAFFRQNEEVILAVTHFTVFLFVMTGIVYETQHWHNPQIRNYVDALYFTVTSLTTTGFGDITLPGTLGRLISVVIMICGVTLFLRLAQVIFRPNKVRFACPSCALLRHEPDAVHCKACGVLLNLPDEGS